MLGCIKSFFKIQYKIDNLTLSRGDSFSSDLLICPRGQTAGWMDGWIDGWMDGWMDGCMDGWMDGLRPTGMSLMGRVDSGRLDPRPG